MSLSKRLEEAAEQRTSQPAPLQVLELRPGTGAIVVCQPEATPATPSAPSEVQFIAIDLRALTPQLDVTQPAPEAPAAPAAVAVPPPPPPLAHAPAPPAAIAPPAPPAAIARPAPAPADVSPKRSGGVSRFGLRRQRIDRRDAKLAEQARKQAEQRRTDAQGHVCPRCGEPARIDIADRTRGVMHLSCDSCFKMWQQRVAVAELPDTPEHAAAPVAS